MAMARSEESQRLQILVRRHPATIYFAATFAISWIGALAVSAPALLRNGTLSKTTGLMMFPVMLLGPSLTGIVLTGITSGKSGLQALLSRMRQFRLGRWYAGLLIPPLLVLIVLFGLKILVSPIYAPNRFFIGVSFGVIAGFLEEIGWMGFAFPAMCLARRSELGAAVLLGLLWGCWHLPVIDYLGTATPHGSYLLPYFLVFVTAMTAMRVLIAWVYTNTKSVFLAQLMHASSTGSLVVLSPVLVTARQEVLWYLVYACALWAVVTVVVSMFGVRLKARALCSV